MGTAYKSYWNPAEQDGVKTNNGSGKAAGAASKTVGDVANNGIVGDVASLPCPADWKCAEHVSARGEAASVSFVGQTIRLSEGESRHLVKVFRARVGDAVTLFDAGGNVWHGVLADTAGRAALVRIERHERIAPSRPRITLGQALPKGKTMDSVIAAMVELGVSQIVPLATDHSEVRIEKDAARAESKREHWQQTAIEAAKQSSNFYGTRIEPICSLRTFLESLPPLCAKGQGAVDPTAVCEAAGTDSVTLAAATPVAAASQLRIIGSLEQGSVPLAALSPQIAAAQEVVCLIGPEGDFSVAEYALARAHGFAPVRLAAHVLRVKTAATYIVSTVDALALAARSAR